MLSFLYLFSYALCLLLLPWNALSNTLLSRAEDCDGELDRYSPALDYLFQLVGIRRFGANVQFPLKPAQFSFNQKERIIPAAKGTKPTRQSSFTLKNGKLKELATGHPRELQYKKKGVDNAYHILFPLGLTPWLLLLGLPCFQPCHHSPIYYSLVTGV